MSEYKFENLSPFKFFMLETFPFIQQEYFDAMNEWQMFCKIGEKINEIINSQNSVGEETEALYNAFINLQNYINNYLDNLDIEEDVNNKLNEMAESGQLADIINQEIFSELNNKINYNNNKFLFNLSEGINQKIICTGDSLTYGQLPNSEAQSSNPYPNLLQTFLNNWYNNNNIIINDGLSGSKSNRALTRFNDYLNQSPDIIIWSYGTNDINQNETINSIIENLQEFYNLCRINNIELIVLGVPPLYKPDLRRRSQHKNLNIAMKNYCLKNSIMYVDLFEYMENIYNSLEYSYTNIQEDGTHFNNYKYLRDAIISQLLNSCFNHLSNISYINIERNYNYSKYNASRVVLDNSFFFKTGLLFNTDDVSNEFEFNFYNEKPSKLILAGYKRNSGCKATFLLDNNEYTFDEYDSNNTSSNATNYQTNFTFPVVIEPGVHKVKLLRFTSDSTSQNRFYLFGFILKNIDILKNFNGNVQRRKQIEAYDGNTGSTTNRETINNIDFTKFNEITLIMGSGSNIHCKKLNPVNAYEYFSPNNTFKFPQHNAAGDNIGVASFTINDATHFSYSGLLNLRKVYVYQNNSLFEPEIFNYNGFNNPILY